MMTYTIHSLDGDVEIPGIAGLREVETGWSPADWSDVALMLVTDADGRTVGWVDPVDGSFEGDGAGGAAIEARIAGVTPHHLHDQSGHLPDARVLAESARDAVALWAGLSRAESESLHDAAYGIVVTDEGGGSVILDYESD